MVQLAIKVFWGSSLAQISHKTYLRGSTFHGTPLHFIFTTHKNARILRAL
jgi:hypothetical protein